MGYDCAFSTYKISKQINEPDILFKIFNENLGPKIIKIQLRIWNLATLEDKDSIPEVQKSIESIIIPISAELMITFTFFVKNNLNKSIFNERINT